MEIVRVGVDAVQHWWSKVSSRGENPVLIFHYLELEVKSRLAEVYPMVEYEKVKVAMITFDKPAEADDFRRFLDGGAELKTGPWIIKWVKPLYYEGRRGRETDFWIIFAYLAVGTELVSRNIATMTDEEIRLWEEEVGRRAQRVTVIRG